MGRQIAIVTTWADERELLQFLEVRSGIRVFRSIAGAPDELWIDDWKTKPIREGHYHIRLTQFSWKPKYTLIKPPCAPEVRDKWYVSNAGMGPVLDFSRHLHGDTSPGRLYWAKHFCATRELSYDVSAFDKLVSALWRWIRQNGVRSGEDAYVMPRALARTGT